MRGHYIVFDTETGGLLNKKTNPALCEFAAIAFDNKTLKEIDRLEILIKPYNDSKDYNEEAFKVNGLSMSLLIDEGIDAKKAVELISNFFKKHKNKSFLPHLVGHNINKFDVPITDIFFEEHGLDLLKFISEDTLDTLDYARMMLPNNPNYKLETVCNEIGIQLPNSHRAMPDTEGNAKLFLEIMNRLRGNSSNTLKKQEKRFRVSFKF